MKLITFEDGWRHFWLPFDEPSGPMGILGFLSAFLVMLALVELLIVTVRRAVKS